MTIEQIFNCIRETSFRAYLFLGTIKCLGLQEVAVGAQGVSFTSFYEAAFLLYAILVVIRDLAKLRKRKDE